MILNDKKDNIKSKEVKLFGKKYIKENEETYLDEDGNKYVNDSYDDTIMLTFLFTVYDDKTKDGKRIITIREINNTKSGKKIEEIKEVENIQENKDENTDTEISLLLVIWQDKGWQAKYSINLDQDSNRLYNTDELELDNITKEKVEKAIKNTLIYIKSNILKGVNATADSESL